MKNHFFRTFYILLCATCFLVSITMSFPDLHATNQRKGEFAQSLIQAYGKSERYVSAFFGDSFFETKESKLKQAIHRLAKTILLVGAGPLALQVFKDKYHKKNTQKQWNTSPSHLTSSTGGSTYDEDLPKNNKTTFTTQESPYKIYERKRYMIPAALMGLATLKSFAEWFLWKEKKEHKKEQEKKLLSYLKKLLAAPLNLVGGVLDYITADHILGLAKIAYPLDEEKKEEEQAIAVPAPSLTPTYPPQESSKKETLNKKVETIVAPAEYLQENPLEPSAPPLEELYEQEDLPRED